MDDLAPKPSVLVAANRSRSVQISDEISELPLDILGILISKLQLSADFRPLDNIYDVSAVRCYRKWGNFDRIKAFVREHHDSFAEKYPESISLMQGALEHVIWETVLDDEEFSVKPLVAAALAIVEPKSHKDLLKLSIGELNGRFDAKEVKHIRAVQKVWRRLRKLI